MKIIKENVNERFDNEYQKIKHYGTHVTETGKSTTVNNRGKYDNEFSTEQYPDELSYELGAEQFALNTIPKGSELSKDKKHPVSFMDNRQRVHLYDPRTKEFTVYKIENGKIITISYYLMRGDDRYEFDRKRNYKSETPQDYNKQVTKTGIHAK